MTMPKPLLSKKSTLLSKKSTLLSKEEQFLIESLQSWSLNCRTIRTFINQGLVLDIQQAHSYLWDVSLTHEEHANLSGSAKSSLFYKNLALLIAKLRPDEPKTFKIYPYTLIGFRELFIPLMFKRIAEFDISHNVKLIDIIWYKLEFDNFTYPLGTQTLVLAPTSDYASSKLHNEYSANSSQSLISAIFRYLVGIEAFNESHFKDTKSIFESIFMRLNTTIEELTNKPKEVIEMVSPFQWS